MNIHVYARASLYALGFLMAGALVLAQSQTTPQKANARQTSSGHAMGREASSGMATGRRQYQGGQATERKSGSVVAADFDSKSRVTTSQPGSQPAAKSLGSAHATESLGASGENPLYEGKDKTAAAPAAHSHEVVEYKDGEDMTTRYRPGNNKTTRANATQNPASAR
jgi:hypothetical protein